MGFRIKDARKEAHMTQDELCAAANICRATLSGLESGRITTTTTDTLKRIADALGVSIGELFL